MITLNNPHLQSQTVNNKQGENVHETLRENIKGEEGWNGSAKGKLCDGSTSREDVVDPPV